MKRLKRPVRDHTTVLLTVLVSSVHTKVLKRGIILGPSAFDVDAQRKGSMVVFLRLESLNGRFNHDWLDRYSATADEVRVIAKIDQFRPVALTFIAERNPALLVACVTVFLEAEETIQPAAVPNRAA